LRETEKIYSEFYKEPFSIRKFFNDHAIGVMGTIAFHMILLIIFLLIKMQSFKDTNELDLLLEFADVPEQVVEELPKEQMSEEEYYQKLLEQQLNASNRASNSDEKLEEEISTENYVDEVMKELDETRSEEWLREQEDMLKKLNQEDIVPINEEEESEKKEDNFTGPTNISYQFLEDPKDRRSLHMPIPVYKCRGFGVVEVRVSVDQLGNVTSAKANVLEASEDPDCLSEVAERYARMSSFRGSNIAPTNQIAIISYRFIAQ
jgi:hypothetical protein